MNRTPLWQRMLLAVLTSVLAAALWQVHQVETKLQYVVQPPVMLQQTDENTQAPNQPLEDAYKRLKDMAGEWDDTMQAWTMSAIREKADYTAENGGTAQGKLTCLSVGGQAVEPIFLREGRGFYKEELETGARVAVLDEGLALALFRISGMVEGQVMIGGAAYEVIGIARHTKNVGDYTDWGAYIPLRSVTGLALPMDAVTVQALPRQGAGAQASFAAICTQWQANGTVIDLGKERVAATLWLRVLICLVVLTVAGRSMGWLMAKGRYVLARGKGRLQTEYAYRLWPGWILQSLALTAGYALCAAGAAWAMKTLVEPVYTFPEWIPAVLVEWEEIVQAFWHVWQDTASMRQWVTPELLRLRFWTGIIQGSCAMCAVLLALQHARRRTTAQKMADGLRGLYAAGVTAVWATCAAPEKMGPWQSARLDNGPEKKEYAEMVRIINGKRMLEALPAPVAEGDAVVEIIDGEIARNNGRWLVACRGGKITVEETSRDWDMQLTVDALALLLHDEAPLKLFMQGRDGCEMKRCTPWMEALFSKGINRTKEGG